MSQPVYIDGEAAGTLTETREGLYRVFRADCAMREGLCRLWLHGGGRSVYFGLLAPESGRLRLTRRFSRAADLPERVDCAQNSPVPMRRKELEKPSRDLLWSRLADGSLSACDGTARYLALPASISPSSPAAKRLRRIGGKDYLVFRR